MIYVCEFNLLTHEIQHRSYHEEYNDSDEPDYVEYDQQFNKVYSETTVSKEAAFLLVLDECSKIYDMFYEAVRILEKELSNDRI